MAAQKCHSDETINKGVAPQTTDRGCGLFNFMGKKEEEDKVHNDTVMIDTPANVVEPKEEKHSLMEKLHRTHSDSSSSSDEEEVEEGSTGEKKRKKKGLKEKIKEKMSSDHENTDQQKAEFIPMDNCPAPNNAELATHEEDKKLGFMDKIKEKLPGHHNKSTDQDVVNTAPAAHSTLDEQVHGSGETKDQKKGLLDKIKEKLPGHGHKNNDDEEKPKCN